MKNKDHFQKISANLEAADRIIARMDHINRRSDRRYQRHLRLVENGYDYSLYRIISNWLTDMLIYGLNIMWISIRRILLNVFMSFVTLCLVVLCNVIFFGSLFMLITK